MSVDFTDSGMDLFSELIKEYSKKASPENVLNVMQEAADTLASDVRALPKPRSNISKPTHLLDTVTTKKIDGEIEVGWGKYYGPMVERGTRRMSAQPHLKPTWERNKKKYVDDMKKKLFK